MVLAGMADNRGEVTRLLAEMALGRSDALDRLMPLVYQELRRIARNQMRGERSGHTLQPTDLVHEAFLRLVDHARRRCAGKRGIPVTLTEGICQRGPGADQSEEILAVHQVLGRLAELDPRQARVVELRYFGGLSVEETAEAIGVATRTVKLDWAMAKSWLKSQLSAGDRP